MHEDFEHCYRAVSSKDPRFDGWFFTAVTSTGIYCRPSCPAMTPKRKNVRFYPTAAAAQHAGFRACKRCRPDAAPGSPEWNTRADVVARAMRMVADGVVDRDGVPGLAGRLGYSVRQLQRLLLAEVGAGALALARAQRAQTARILIETTDLTMAELALAAGFASIRQFNDTVQAVFATTPSVLREKARRRDARRPAAADARRPASADGRGPHAPDPTTAHGPTPFHADLSLKLPFRAPLNPSNLFGHLAATAVPGVEHVEGNTYSRTLRLAHGPAIAALTPHDDHVALRLNLADTRDLTAAIARCRWLLDLDADPVAVDAQLARDPALAPLTRRGPGRRVPRTPDGAEFAIRAVLGQQVSTAAARTLAARLVQTHGEPVEGGSDGLTHLFPQPAALLDAALAGPQSRRRTLLSLARALDDHELVLDPGADHAQARATLASLPGLGPWTQEVIAMRALGDPDAFPSTDLGVRRGAQALGIPDSPNQLESHAQAWRPWRAYAVQYMWATHEHPINHWPPTPQATTRKTRSHDDSHDPTSAAQPRRHRADEDHNDRQPDRPAAADRSQRPAHPRAHARPAPRRRARA